MSLTTPYPADLLLVARKVVWYEQPEETLADLMTFLAHLMVYGSSADVSVAERYVPAGEFHEHLRISLLMRVRSHNQIRSRRGWRNDNCTRRSCWAVVLLAGSNGGPISLAVRRAVGRCLLNCLDAAAAATQHAFTPTSSGANDHPL